MLLFSSTVCVFVALLQSCPCCCLVTVSCRLLDVYPLAFVSLSSAFLQHTLAVAGSIFSSPPMRFLLDAHHHDCRRRKTPKGSSSFCSSFFHRLFVAIIAVVCCCWLLRLKMCRRMCNYLRLWVVTFFALASVQHRCTLLVCFTPSFLPRSPSLPALTLSTTLTHAAAEEIFSIFSVSIPLPPLLWAAAHRSRKGSRGGREVEEVARKGTHTQRRSLFMNPYSHARAYLI